MKAVLSIVILLSFAFSVLAQVYSEPTYATQNDSIIIYFDATQGDQGLMGYPGNDVYAYTGVITNYSTGPTDWKYVIWTSWNQNPPPPQTQLTRIAPDLYKLVVGYPRQYYGVSIPMRKYCNWLSSSEIPTDL